ncbi:MAG TPA: histidine ammonia-lyase [Anaerolineales bacterium]|nr:histidine ammonia-lyase [Anaerolineales bacterium]HRQ92934.1 histidine ammonia-lyase [Anaerolineales bacterium]
MANTPIEIDGEHLSLHDVVQVAHNKVHVHLAATARQRVTQSQAWVEDIIQRGKPVYGINTGFGIFADKQISPEDARTLNRNLILSHATATGPELPAEVVRAAMLIRANTLAAGHSGARPELIETLLAMLNQGVTPIIPSQGSLGSSGDLAPLAQLALVMSTDAADREQDSGWAVFNGQRMSGKAAMAAAGIPRLVLGPKEGLAITNGATFSAALGALTLVLAEDLLAGCTLAAAMSLEAMQGASAALDARLHAARKQPGQMAVAERMRAITEGSTLLNTAGRVQDVYSLRCAPQILGPAYDALAYVRGVIEREINAATDNPLLFDGHNGEAVSISGGNFHGEPVGMALDFLKIALSEVAAVSERRSFLLLDSKMSGGLPAMLVANEAAAGLNSGMMMLQYTAASLVLENQTLAAPDSVRSLPTSAGQEDHNANAMTAARHAWQIAHNCAHVLAVELTLAARALDLRLAQLPGAQPGHGTAAALAAIRQQVPFEAGDALWAPGVARIKTMIVAGELTRSV